MNCSERQAWLASKKGVGAGAGEGGKDPCLCTVAASGSLPRVFVDIYQDVPGIKRSLPVDEVLSTRNCRMP